jgi:hypothetical protein
MPWIRIADTFTESLGQLTGDEQKAVKTTAFDLELNPANPGTSFHKLDKAKDRNFWSVRVNADIRLIVHRRRGRPAGSASRARTTGERPSRILGAGGPLRGLRTRPVLAPIENSEGEGWAGTKTQARYRHVEAKPG